jgi:hypothetical protein
MECKQCKCELTELEIRANISVCAKCYLSKEEKNELQRRKS